mmetsp:Transcript_52804/g.123962  ORF Transcript_52804/g.123962 Transcript_52804/m.123962 type:complete len:214 (-) Transcript_52804:22-663(-)
MCAARESGVTRTCTRTTLPGATLHLVREALAFLPLVFEGITENRVGALDAARSSQGVPLVAVAVPYLSIAPAGAVQPTVGVGGVITSFASTAVPDTRGGISAGLAKGELSLCVPPSLHLLTDLHQVQPGRAHQALHLRRDGFEVADETGRAVGTKLEDPKDVLNGRLHLRGKAEFLNSEVEKGGRKVEGASLHGTLSEPVHSISPVGVCSRRA